MKALRAKLLGEKMMQFSLDVICTVDQRGHLLTVSEACKKMLGYERNELIGRKIFDLVHPKDCKRTLQAGREVGLGSGPQYLNNHFIHKSGKEVPVSWSVAWVEEAQTFFCIGRDATEQKLAGKKLQEKDELYQSMVAHGFDILTLFDENLNYTYCGASISRALGYESEQLIGANALDFIHPEDVPLIRESLSNAMASKSVVEVSEYRFKDAQGNWRWLESRGSNQLQNSSVKAVIVSSRDVTEKVENRLMLQKSEERFKSLFEHHLDVVFFQGVDGRILDVNAATLSFLGVQKENLVSRQLTDILSAEVVQDFEQGLRDALDGKPVHFVSTLPFEGKGSCVFDIVKIPVVVNGAIIGVYCIFRDVTEIVHSNYKIKQQAEKLSVILESITDSFFTLDKNWCFAFVNNEFERLVGVQRKELVGKNVWELTQEGLNGEFQRQFNLAVDERQAVQFETYYERLGKWLEVKAFPSEEGLSVFINDITERVKSKQELEKLSLVASKTVNGVVISTPAGVTEWVNDGFTKITGYSFSEVEGKLLSSLLQGKETDQATVKRLSENWKQKKPFSEEILNYKKSGETMWLLLDVTPILDEHREVIKLVSIQTDITERKKAEEKQLQLTRDLYSQNSDLQQFTYIVSHNLRAPIANAMGLVDVLASLDKSSENFQVFLEYLKTSIHKMDTVLRDLNKILSIRDKKGTIEKEEVNLASVCRQAMEELEDSLKACGGEIFTNIEEGICVNANKAYLYSIFYNLLSNAVKYRSPQRALKVAIECSRSQEGGIVISVSDNGLGFDREIAGDNIFRLYKRFHTHVEGRGIGLFLVKTHLEAMDGHIEVSSKVNAGTRFVLYLK